MSTAGRRFAATLTAAQDKLRPLGVISGFHNHQVEWRPVGGTRPMDIIAAGTPKDFVLQLDAGTCVEVGASQPGRLDQGEPRPHQEHSPQGLRHGEGRGLQVAFSEGDVRSKPLLEAAESTGGIEYYLIEQEHAGADGELAMAKRCLDNYRKLRA